MNENRKLTWTENFTVRSFEIDLKGQATIQTICRYIQEAAINHAAHLKVDKYSMDDLNITWVLSRLQIRMDRYPFWKEAVTVETWPVLKDKHFAIRDYELSDGKGKSIGVGTSSWMMIDLNTRRPIPLPSFMEGIENIKRSRALDSRFERLPELEKPEFQKSFHVRHSDLDINLHVNYVHYIEWALEAVPREILKDNQLYELEVGFRAESVYGDSISSQCQQAEANTYLHKIMRISDNMELTRLVSRWRPYKF
ncbi:MAG: hypothetical protein JXB44_00685 [Calditrichaceae bacterium]|nr:hypothetical protein [Calditrichaceae bacterium]RQV97564.1 MAG: hypothetical protein EH224_00650 [Calditrichota bacterium]